MKKHLFLLLLSFVLYVFHAKAEGIKFFEGSWKEILAEAKAQNKPIFIDIYTTWCGPCKQMSKNIFPLDNVGEKFNSLFINYKIDAEKGEGIELAKKYNVEAYPTYLFVDANESLLYKSIGSMPAAKFIAEADLAMASMKDEKPLSAWDKEYADGKRGADFLLAYMEKRSKIKMSNAEVLEEYLKTQSAAELSSEKNLILMIDNVASIESKAFETLIQNKEKIMNARGDRRFMNFSFRASDIVRRTAAKATKNQDKALIEKCVSINKIIYSDPMMSNLAEKANADIYMKFYKATKDKDNFWQTASTYIDKYVMSKSVESIKKIDDGNYERFMQMYRTGVRDSAKDERFQEMKTMMGKMESNGVAGELNNAAWSAIELFDDKETLEKVAPWLERALLVSKQAHILDSQAHLLFKMGKKKQAIKVAKEAIKLAKAEGKEVAEYEKFLAEIQK